MNLSKCISKIYLRLVTEAYSCENQQCVVNKLGFQIVTINLLLFGCVIPII